MKILGIGICAAFCSGLLGDSAFGGITNPANGHVYELTPTSLTWQDARTYAHSRGGELVTVRDQAENDWLFQTFWASRISGSLWIGLTDEVTEADWRWVSGEPVTFINWWTAGGAPNNAPTSAAGEDYGQIFEIANNGMWDDYPSPFYTNLVTGQTYRILNQGIVEIVPAPPSVVACVVAAGAVLRRRRRSAIE